MLRSNDAANACHDSKKEMQRWYMRKKRDTIASDEVLDHEVSKRRLFYHRIVMFARPLMNAVDAR